MHRPFLVIGIAVITASFITFKSGVLEAVLLLVVAMSVCIMFTVKNRDKIFKGVFIALIFMVIIIRFVSLIGYVENTNLKLAGRTVKIDGTVTSVLNNQENFSRIMVKIKQSSDQNAKGIVTQITVPESTSAIPGDRITAKVEFVEQDAKYKAYNYSNQRYFTGVAESITVFKTETFSTYRLTHNIREKIRQAVSLGGTGEECAVLNALIVGDTSMLSDELYNNVKASGVSHMLVVSGMHLGIICGLLIKTLRHRTRRWVTILMGIITAAFITFICLFHVSIVRASIAYFVMLAGRLLKRDSDGLSSLGFGVAVTTFVCPYIFYNVAFILSVSATFAVLYPSDMLIKAVSFKKFGKVMGKVFRYVYDILAVAVSAMVCTLPIVAYYFGYVVLIAPVTNLVVSFSVSAALIMGILAVIISFVPIIGQYLCQPFFFIARTCARYFISAVNLIGSSGFGILNISQNKIIYCFFIPVAFILLVRIFYIKQCRKKEKAYIAERQNT